MRHTRQPKSKVLSVKLPCELSARVARLAHERRTTVSEVVRDALELYQPEGREPSFADAVAPYIGVMKGPRDLATSPRHMKGFGED